MSSTEPDNNNRCGYTSYSCSMFVKYIALTVNIVRMCIIGEFINGSVTIASQQGTTRMHNKDGL